MVAGDLASSRILVSSAVSSWSRRFSAASSLGRAEARRFEAMPSRSTQHRTSASVTSAL